MKIIKGKCFPAYLLIISRLQTRSHQRGVFFFSPLRVHAYAQCANAYVCCLLISSLVYFMGGGWRGVHM